MSDWRELMGAPASPASTKHTHNTQNKPGKPSSADIAYKNQGTESDAPLQSAVAAAPSDNRPRPQILELIYIEPREKVTPVNPKFPCCSACGYSRYWISPLGKVVCGGCSRTRFILASISYHPIN